MRRLVLVIAVLALAPAAPGATRFASASQREADRGRGAVQGRGAAPVGETQREVAATAEQLKTAIDRLGTIDYAVRAPAARLLRRAPAAIAVPALLDAIVAHKDGYVRFRALVLLSGFNDPRTKDVMAGVLAAPNDRLRTVAYTYFEHHPDPQILPRLLEALDREESEFVRPALTRTLAAYGSDSRARDVLTGLVLKGQDYFRSIVIEALGDYKAGYALKPITDVARLDGPLQDDAVIALGKIGDKRSLETLAALQRSAPRTVQPSIAAAICLLGINCSSHQGYLVQMLRFGIDTLGFQELLRAAASGLAALAIAGDASAVSTLIEAGAPSRDPARAAIALALGAVALRNTPLMLKVLEGQKDPKPAIVLLSEAFDMLEEDLEEERFFVAVRRGYWAAPAGSSARKIAAALIQTLDF
jgi:HEAT repeat protein